MFTIIYIATTRNEKENMFNSKVFKKLLKYKNVFFKKKLKSYLYLNKRIMLLRLKIIKSRYISFYIIYFK